jgi:signal transduction histidine kinase
MIEKPRDQPGAAMIIVRMAPIAVLALSLGVLTGYAMNSPMIVAAAPGLRGMSPLTALAAGSLAVAILALIRGWRQAAQAEILQRRVGEQAALLARESAEREKAEAAMAQVQRMEALGQLTGAIAHDFNNLLMGIGGNLYLLTSGLPEDHPARRYAKNASLATERGARLTSQLLAFSRTRKMEIRPVELDPALSDARALLENAMGPAIQVELRLDAKGCWISTDPDLLQVAILNLAANARHAMPDGGSLTIVSGFRAGRSGNDEGRNDHDKASYLSIEVRDTGEGMSREVAARATEPFFTTKARGEGSGLGLAQVYGFVRQSHGDLRIESEVGVGTTVELLLPSVGAPADRSASLILAGG